MSKNIKNKKHSQFSQKKFFFDSFFYFMPSAFSPKENNYNNSGRLEYFSYYAKVNTLPITFNQKKKKKPLLHLQKGALPITY